jgi:hypothetical protein
MYNKYGFDFLAYLNNQSTFIMSDEAAAFLLQLQKKSTYNHNRQDTHV